MWKENKRHTLDFMEIEKAYSTCIEFVLAVYWKMQTETFESEPMTVQKICCDEKLTKKNLPSFKDGED